MMVIWCNTIFTIYNKYNYFSNINSKLCLH